MQDQTAEQIDTAVTTAAAAADAWAAAGADTRAALQDAPDWLVAAKGRA